jgi:hypothetical protein
MKNMQINRDERGANNAKIIIHIVKNLDIYRIATLKRFIWERQETQRMCQL